MVVSEEREVAVVIFFPMMSPICHRNVSGEHNISGTLRKATLVGPGLSPSLSHTG